MGIVGAQLFLTQDAYPFCRPVNGNNWDQHSCIATNKLSLCLSTSQACNSFQVSNI